MVRIALNCGILGGFLLWSTASQCDEPAKKPLATVTVEVIVGEFQAIGNDRAAMNVPDVTHPLERLTHLQKHREAGSVSKYRLSTLDRLPASVQVGEMVPIATSRATRPGNPEGRASGFNTGYSMVNIGTMVQVTPQVEEGGTVIVELSIERSRLAFQKPQSAEPNEANRAMEGTNSRTVTVMSKTTVRVPARQTVAATMAHMREKDDTGDLLILVSASVNDSPGGEPGDAALSGELRIYRLKYASAEKALPNVQAHFRGTAELRVTADPRTNSLVAFGSSEALQHMEEFLQILDKE